MNVCLFIYLPAITWQTDWTWTHQNGYWTRTTRPLTDVHYNNSRMNIEATRSKLILSQCKVAITDWKECASVVRNDCADRDIFNIHRVKLNLSLQKHPNLHWRRRSLSMEIKFTNLKFNLNKLWVCLCACVSVHWVLHSTQKWTAS